MSVLFLKRVGQLLYPTPTVVFSFHHRRRHLLLICSILGILASSPILLLRSSSCNPPDKCHCFVFVTESNGVHLQTAPLLLGYKYTGLKARSSSKKGSSHYGSNYVDRHISPKDQITLQDTMDGVVYSTSKFGLHYRFVDGVASELDLGVAMDVQVFLLLRVVHDH